MCYEVGGTIGLRGFLLLTSLFAASGAGAQTTDPCDLVNGTSVVETTSAGACRVLLWSSTVTGNGIFGVTVGGPTQPCSQGRFKASGSTLSGNGVAAGCLTTQGCGDVAASSLPALNATSTCDRSYVLGSGLPGSSWSICRLD